MAYTKRSKPKSSSSQIRQDFDETVKKLEKTTNPPQNKKSLGVGKQTAAEGREYSKKGKTPAMGFKVGENVKKPGRTSSRSKRLRTKLRQILRELKEGSKYSDLAKVATGSKKGGTVSRKGGGTIKKQVGGLPQGYNARLDESLAARHPAVRGNLAARRAESEGMERALGRGPYSGARTMAKKGGSVRRKKGGTTSRKGGGKIMVGYKAGGKV